MCNNDVKAVRMGLELAQGLNGKTREGPAVPAVSIKQPKGDREMKAARFCALLMVSIVALVLVNAPALASETDTRIETSARQSYVFRTYLKDDAIEIEARDGVVILTGTVLVEPHKAMAQETVASLPGVTSVDNRLVLLGTPAAGSADAMVSARVRTALQIHRNLSAVEPDIQVDAGVVTLRGEASSQAQIDLTTEYIEDVEGVKDVENEMIVSASPEKPADKTIGEKVGGTMGTIGETIDDASITALVKMSLMYHRSTSAFNTNVDTDAGIVTLVGTVKNASEKDLATKFASDVYGVKAVINNMTIESTEPEAH